MLEVIDEMTINDKTKERIVYAGALSYYVKLLQPGTTGSGTERSSSRTVIVASKCKEAIHKEPDCVEGKQSNCYKLLIKLNFCLHYTVHPVSQC